jgi:hypothetical protein
MYKNIGSYLLLIVVKLKITRTILFDMLRHDFRHIMVYKICLVIYLMWYSHAKMLM